MTASHDFEVLFPYEIVSVTNKKKNMTIIIQNKYLKKYLEILI